MVKRCKWCGLITIKHKTRQDCIEALRERLESLEEQIRNMEWL
jgi:hypothetical protein